MSETRIGSVASNEDLLALLAQQMAKLGIGINQLDEICGLPAGLSAKVLGPSAQRRFGPFTQWLVFPELGLRVDLVEDPELLAKRRLPGKAYQKVQARFGNVSSRVSSRVISRVFKHFASNGGRARWRGTTKEERAEHGRNMVKAREKRRHAKRVARASVSAKSRAGERGVPV